jgi:hypothetical protein
MCRRLCLAFSTGFLGLRYVVHHLSVPEKGLKFHKTILQQSFRPFAIHPTAYDCCTTVRSLTNTPGLRIH